MNDKLKSILDECNLTSEERRAFEDFVDGKALKEYIPQFNCEEQYPDFDKAFKEAVQDNPLLKAAYTKMRENGQWGKCMLFFITISCINK